MAEKLGNRLKPKKEEIDLEIDDQFVELAEQNEEELVEAEEMDEVTALKPEKKKLPAIKNPRRKKKRKQKRRKKKLLQLSHKPFSLCEAKSLKN